MAEHDAGNQSSVAFCPSQIRNPRFLIFFSVLAPVISSEAIKEILFSILHTVGFLLFNCDVRKNVIPQEINVITTLRNITELS